MPALISVKTLLTRSPTVLLDFWNVLVTLLNLSLGLNTPLSIQLSSSLISPPNIPVAFNSREKMQYQIVSYLFFNLSDSDLI